MTCRFLSGISAWREGIGFSCHLCWSLWCYLIWNLSLIGKVACLQNYLILSSSFLGFLCPEAVYFLNSSSLFLFKTLVRNAAAAAKSLQSWSDSVRPHRQQPTRLPAGRTALLTHLGISAVKPHPAPLCSVPVTGGGSRLPLCCIHSPCRT